MLKYVVIFIWIAALSENPLKTDLVLLVAKVKVLVIETPEKDPRKRMCKVAKILSETG